MRCALFQPDIPQNLGAAIRNAACFACPLDIIEPCGFALTDKALKRAAMDYADLAQISRIASWAAFHDRLRAENRRLVLFTTKGATPLDAFAFQSADILLFGRESAGVPDEVHEAADCRVAIALAPRARSLNLSVSLGIALFEARRQLGWSDGEASPNLAPPIRNRP